MVGTAPPLKLIPFATAAEAAPGFAATDLPDLDSHLDRAPADFLGWLAAEGHWATAWAFLARALPRREAVWWATRCVRSVLPEPIALPAATALAAAETWTAAPGDVNRRKAFPLAEAVGVDHPAGCVALVVFLSGGSMAPAQLKEVPPPPGAADRALVGAILIAAAQAPPVEIAATNHRFLDLALGVARGTDRWPNPT